MRGRAFLDPILPFIPDSLVREKIRHACNLHAGASVRLAVAALGNGIGLSAPDTVPFALWCAAQHLDDYAQALWLTVSGLGDRDTTCAMEGGIVALNVGVEVFRPPGGRRVKRSLHGPYTIRQDKQTSSWARH